MKKLLILSIVIFALTSCFKDDEVVPPHQPGDVKTVEIPLTQYYVYQYYFNLATAEKVSFNDRSVFDLNFECIDTSTVIRLNTSNFALIAETPFEKFGDVQDTVGLQWRFDKSDGDIDSLAISNWINIDGSDTTYSNKVWVLNRGLNPMGLQLGLIKIKFTAYKNNKFYFSYSKFNSEEIIDAVAEKNPNYLTVQFSLENGGEPIQTEPEKSNWDLLFSQYTTLLFTSEGLPYPYIVTGTLQKSGLAVAVDSSLVFSDITLSDTLGLDFSKSTDAIGYTWKRIVGNVETGNYHYETRIEWNYIIRDDYNYYYKLRFIDFYNQETGEKGYPVFEYQSL